MILNWKDVANKMESWLKDKDFDWKYVAILLLSSDDASKVYVNLKKEFWERVWLEVKVFSDENNNIISSDIQNILDTINKLNKDDSCAGIVVQLPLNSNISDDTWRILGEIDPWKDIDWLWWVLFGLNLISKIDFLPATPKAVFEILEYYGLQEITGKKILIVWQSNLVWKPLALEFMKRQWEVVCVNEFCRQQDLRKYCKESDYIVSATWQSNLLTSDFFRSDFSQIVIDVGFCRQNWKIYWDVDYNNVKQNVYAITPVPGWVGPVTVASIFKNLYLLQNNFV